MAKTRMEKLTQRLVYFNLGGNFELKYSKISAGLPLEVKVETSAQGCLLLMP